MLKTVNNYVYLKNLQTSLSNRLIIYKPINIKFDKVHLTND